MGITTDQLLTFFKVMADESRLKIVGLLAKQPRTVEELAMLLGLGASTISHHMSKLQKAGLVQAQAQQYYSVYSLNQSALQDMAAHIATAMKPETMMTIINETKEIDQNAFEKSVIEKALHDGGDGRLGLPTGLLRMRIVLRWVGRNKFELGKRYTEAQVEDILERSMVGPDTNHARRYMVDEKVLDRKPDGSFYWRADTPMRQSANAVGFDPDMFPLSDHVVTTERLIERKVMSAFMRSGRFVVPETNDDGMQVGVLKVMWNALRLRFERDKAQTEAQADSLIAKWAYGDPARIRGLLVQHGFLVHRKKTDVYLRADAGEAEPADVLAAHIADDRITQLPGTPTERKIVLGWLADKLPPRKRLHRDDLDAIIDAHKPARAKTDDVRNALMQMELLDRKGDMFWRAV